MIPAQSTVLAPVHAAANPPVLPISPSPSLSLPLPLFTQRSQRPRSCIVGNKHIDFVSPVLDRACSPDLLGDANHRASNVDLYPWLVDERPPFIGSFPMRRTIHIPQRARHPHSRLISSCLRRPPAMNPSPIALFQSSSEHCRRSSASFYPAR